MLKSQSGLKKTPKSFWKWIEKHYNLSMYPKIYINGLTLFLVTNNEGRKLSRHIIFFILLHTKVWLILRASKIRSRKWELNAKLMNLDNALSRYLKFLILLEVPVNLFSQMFFQKVKRKRSKRNKLSKNILKVSPLRLRQLKIFNHLDCTL